MDQARTRGERGAVLILLALSLVGLLAVAAVVIDGGQAYAQRRQMQNAADAAAMAGAAALDDTRFTVPATATWTDVESEVERVSMSSNGADQVLGCYIVNIAGARLGECSEQAAVTSAAAVGVEVEVRDTRSTTFGKVIGQSSMSATADAMATVQPIAGVRAPWAICSSGAKYDILTPDLEVDPVKAAALGEIVIQGSQVYKDDPGCAAKKGRGGGAASFKGPIDQQMVTVGDNTLAESDPGNDLPAGWEDYKVTCTVAPMTRDCILLPVAYKVEGTGTNAEISIAGFAFFRVRQGHTGKERLLGTYVAVTGPIQAPGAVTGIGVPTAGELRTISLVE